MYKNTKIVLLILVILIFLSIHIEAKKNNEFKLNYLLKIGKQTYGFQRFEMNCIINKDDEIEWIVSGEEIYFLRQKMSGGDYVITEYKTKIKARLASDFTLLDYRSNTLENDKLSECIHMYFNQNSYMINIVNRKKDKKKEQVIKVDKPCYLYKTWIIDSLVQNNLLKEDKELKFIRENSINKYLLNSFYLKRLTVKDKTNLIFLVSGQGDKIFIDNIHNRLAKMFFKESKVTVTSGNIHKDKIKALDVTKFSIIPSNVLFLYKNKLSRLNLKVKMPFEVDDNNYLNSTRQSFKGRADEKGFYGELIINAKEYISSKNIPFPLNKVWQGNLKQYLNSTPNIEVNSLEIRNKAKEITEEITTTWNASKAIAKWVYKNIKYKDTQELTALETLRKGYGLCAEKALLVVALCRAVNIPARVIRGFSYDLKYNAFVSHAWIEVYLGKDGWIPLDPTQGQFEFVDASHIAYLFNTGNGYIYNFDKVPEIKVLNYSPASAVVVNRKINFSVVGDFNKTRSYIVKQDSQEIGSYKSKLIRKNNKPILLEEFNNNEKNPIKLN
ncbi:transglutaminase superfamily protein [Orenia metallireducens]|uniref:Transglutaminase-like superfamily protein n=1 Tax=Orenia metallireducens TaxID=1413210 RepID=A0A285H200_9FIRM|nr:transglutaminase-like domain-containing protein [Orenia metallireducens]PRX29421.1 transglutaminase superfamily protein [Orenia metallireducens]SNY29718.1 Transglutaminase-like superfamily protein [Orenia metallireducens]